MATLLAATLVAWIVTVERMLGMDAGPGTDLGGLGWFLGIWVTMMAAMMLPSVSPMVLLFARVSREQARRGQAVLVPTWLFVAGYLAVWTVAGLAAYGIYRAFVSAGTDWLAWDRAGPYVTGAALLAAGLYQLTPLKDVCLRHCRSPLHFLLHGWRPGRIGAVRMGMEHGAYCLGCCWGLMLALFALGVMSLFWMAVVGAVILVEKLAPARAAAEPARRRLARRARRVGHGRARQRARPRAAELPRRRAGADEDDGHGAAGAGHEDAAAPGDADDTAAPPAMPMKPKRRCRP